MSEPDYIPEPTIIMFGPRAIDAGPVETARCPVCRGGILDGHDTRYCAVCDSMSPRREAQVRAARLGLAGRDRDAAAVKRTRDRLRRQARTVLTEAERRRYWYGSKKALGGERELTNAAKLGRDWLTRIGQVPDWSIDLAKNQRAPMR